MTPVRLALLLVAGTFGLAATISSSLLIWRHQSHMSCLSIQSKIVGIIWMVPIYSIDSFLGLLIPSAALYIDMLRDCYEAYVLYLFLSLMMSYLDCDEDDFALVSYLETKPPLSLPFPFSLFCRKELPKGRAFLRYCKFGVMQYCVVRPLTTLAAICLDRMGLYHESDFSPEYGFLYLVIAINISIAYAFVVLMTFYTALKYRLAPYEPVGKFLCIKFVIFFAFWQGVVIAGLVKFRVIRGIEGYTAHELSTSLQDLLICVEMFLVSLAHFRTFSYKPFLDDAEYQSALLAIASPSPSPLPSKKALYFNNSISRSASSGSKSIDSSKGSSNGGGGRRHSAIGRHLEALRSPADAQSFGRFSTPPPRELLPSATATAGRVERAATKAGSSKPRGKSATVSINANEDEQIAALYEPMLRADSELLLLDTTGTKDEGNRSRVEQASGSAAVPKKVKQQGGGNERIKSRDSVSGNGSAAGASSRSTGSGGASRHPYASAAASSSAAAFSSSGSYSSSGEGSPESYHPSNTSLNVNRNSISTSFGGWISELGHMAMRPIYGSSSSTGSNTNTATASAQMKETAATITAARKLHKLNRSGRGNGHHGNSSRAAAGKYFDAVRFEEEKDDDDNIASADDSDDDSERANADLLPPNQSAHYGNTSGRPIAGPTISHKHDGAYRPPSAPTVSHLASTSNFPSGGATVGVGSVKSSLTAGVALAQTVHKGQRQQTISAKRKSTTGTTGNRPTSQHRPAAGSGPGSLASGSGPRPGSSIFDRHFASSAAVRDFNEAMPVVIPSSFKPVKGTVIISRPEDRLAQTDD